MKRDGTEDKEIEVDVSRYFTGCLIVIMYYFTSGTCKYITYLV